MRIAFIGIGALGGYFGGRLAKAGNDVIFLARGAMLEALRKNGLRIESPLGDFALPKVHATSDPAAVGHVDAVFVTTKAWQVTEAAQQIRGIVGPETVVVPLQNGVEAYDQLAAVLGSGHVLDGLCHILAMVIAPGVVRHAGPKPDPLGERTYHAGKIVPPPPPPKYSFPLNERPLPSFFGRDAECARGQIAARSRDAGDYGPSARLRHSSAERVGGRNDEIRRVVAARRHSFDAARFDRGPAVGTRSAERGGRPNRTRQEFSNPGARVHLQRAAARRTACPSQADVLNLLQFRFRKR